MSGEQLCPRCGRVIPLDAPGAVCSYCLLKLAEESSEETLVSPGTKSTSSILDSRFLLSRQRWWVLALFVAVATVYTGYRLIWSETHIRPGLKFDEQLRPAFDPHLWGVSEQAQITHVNAIGVQDRADLAPAYDSRGGVAIDFDFNDDGQTRRVTWMRARHNPAFIASSDGVVAGDEFPDMGLEGSERIIAINGVALASIEMPLTADELRRDFSAIRTRFTVEDEATGSEREIVVMRYGSAQYWGRLITGFAFGIVGLLGYRLRPRSRSAKAFTLFCLFVMTMWYSRSISFYGRTGLENAVYAVLQCLLPAASVLFLITFTPLRLVVRRPDWWVAGAAVAGLVLIPINFLWNPGSAASGLLHMPLFLAWAIAMLAIAVLGLAAPLLVRLLGTRLRPADRGRYAIMWIAIALSFLPAALHLVFRHAFLTPTTYSLASELVVLVFPIVVLYAIVKHNILNLNELAREGVMYGLFLVGITLTYSAIAALSSVLLDPVFDADQPWFRTGLMAGLFVMAIPVHTAARAALDRRFTRVPAAYQNLIDSLDDSAFRQSSPFTYCKHVVDRVQRITSARSVALFTNFEEFGGWAMGAMWPTPMTEQSTERCRELLALVEERKQPVFVDDLLEHELDIEDYDEVVQGLYAYQADIAYPLVAYGRVVGVFLIGEKTNGMGYRAAELRSLQKLSDRVALHLVNLLGRIVPSEGLRAADIFPRYPARIDGYAIEGVVGEGGMAYVYLGSDGTKQAAIKIANRMVQASPKLMERFHREAAAIQRVKSPYVAAVHGVGWHGSEPYIALEYCSRGTVETLLKSERTVSERAALCIVRDAAKGLATAHSHGIVHRDIKPSNMYLREDGSVAIGDFGLALLDDRTPITRTGEIFGTPEYMSPELGRGERGDWRSDQYALGVTLYRLLCGAPPFHGANFEAVLYQHIHAPVPSFPADVRRQASASTLHIVQRMLAKAPEERYPSYAALIDALETSLAELQ